MMFLFQLAVSILSLSPLSSAFVSVSLPCRSNNHRGTTDLTMMTPSSLIIATIDSDIANIPTNEFAPIFAGGLTVMFGGLFSTILLGYFLEKRNLYGQIVAESFSQADSEQAFWNGLSDEDREKTMELMKRMKQGREEEGVDMSATLNAIVTQASTAAAKNQNNGATTSTEEASLSSRSEAVPKAPAKELDMFSDY